MIRRVKILYGRSGLKAMQGFVHQMCYLTLMSFYLRSPAFVNAWFLVVVVVKASSFFPKPIGPDLGQTECKDFKVSVFRVEVNCLKKCVWSFQIKSTEVWRSLGVKQRIRGIPQRDWTKQVVFTYFSNAVEWQSQSQICSALNWDILHFRWGPFRIRKNLYNISHKCNFDRKYRHPSLFAKLRSNSQIPKPVISCLKQGNIGLKTADNEWENAKNIPFRHTDCQNSRYQDLK